MKTIAISLTLLNCGLLAYASQTNQNQITLEQAPSRTKATMAPAESPTAPSTSVALTQTNTTHKLLRQEKNYGGALPALRKRKMQVFRSSYPASPEGFHNVSVNPITGQSEGIILFSINF